jgi:hypothetical protein
MQWLNEPPQWTDEDGVIVATSAHGSDFWRKTHYDFIRDSGHFYHARVSGDFVLGLKIEGDYNALYDQAGAMLRLSETEWIKCGIEYMDDVQHAAAVVTREFSDWSVVPLGSPPALWLRVKREREAVEVTYSVNGEAYQLLRLAYLPPSESVLAGLLIASPDGPGFQARFSELHIEPLTAAAPPA